LKEQDVPEIRDYWPYIHPNHSAPVQQSSCTSNLLQVRRLSMRLPLLIAIEGIVRSEIVEVVGLEWRMKRYLLVVRVGHGGLADSIGCRDSRLLSPGH